MQYRSEQTAYKLMRTSDMPAQSAPTLAERYARVCPGPQSNLRTPPGTHPVFIARGRGARIWDEEGKQYIDFTASAGPGILGHGNPELLAALKDQLDVLYHAHPGEVCTRLQMQLAEKIRDHVPCAQAARFVLSGSEAVQLALRLARAYTGRNTFIRFEGHYHGWLDNVSGGAIAPGADSYSEPHDPPADPLFTAGRGRGSFHGSLLLPWNDTQVLEAAFRTHGHDLALVLMEPIMCNGGCCWPNAGYLQRVRQLCDEHGTLLCFDEILTGFRMGLGGAQSELAVTPDLATFGKALAGGIPLAVVAGRREVMDLLLKRTVISGGTFNGYPLGTAAALATVDILARDDGRFFRELRRRTHELTEGLRTVAQRRGVPLLIQGINGLITVMFTSRRSATNIHEFASADMPRYHRFAARMRERGVLLLWNGRWYLHGGFADEDIAAAIACADAVLGEP
jgi:glutamate-1-semialdehyde 2,1-aminomutase